MPRKRKSLLVKPKKKKGKEKKKGNQNKRNFTA